MATPLLSLIVRESTEQVDERNILVALTEDQRISFRLKGMKSGVLSIPIKELYEQLAGKPQPTPTSDNSILLLRGSEDIIQRLRVKNATTPGKIELIARMDEFIVELLEEIKNKKA